MFVMTVCPWSEATGRRFSAFQTAGNMAIEPCPSLAIHLAILSRRKLLWLFNFRRGPCGNWGTGRIGDHIGLSMLSRLEAVPRRSSASTQRHEGLHHSSSQRQYLVRKRGKASAFPRVVDGTEK